MSLVTSAATVRWLHIVMIAAVFFLTSGGLRSFADPPLVEHIYPAGYARGSTNTMTIAGKFEPWPPQVWVSCPGITWTSETNKGLFQIQVAAHAPIGPHLLRFFNDDGSSAPRIFVISTGKELLESEPNNHFAKAQPIGPLPVSVNGRLDKLGDVDSFAISLTAGQSIEARLEAYTLASKVDALLRLVTTDGVQQAWNHDFVTLDPRLFWQAASNGTYVVQVMGFKYPADAEVRFTGGNGCVYRLHVAGGAQAAPCPTSGTPEAEPNNSLTNALVLTLPAVVRGAIDGVEDQDCFGFTVAKDEIIEGRVEADSLGSRLDAWLNFVDGSGKELARTDDANRSRDPRLEWKAPTNGTFYAVLGNVLHAGGPGHEYRLSLRRVSPDYQATIAASAIIVTAGETNDVKITLNRLRGFDRTLRAAFQGLPSGIRAEGIDLPAKSGDVTIKLMADPSALPAQVPVRIVIMDSQAGEERPVVFSLIGSSEDNGVPGGYTALLVESTDQLWLTVKPKPAAK